MNKHTDALTNRQIDRQIDTQMRRKPNKQMYSTWTYAQTQRKIDGNIDQQFHRLTVMGTDKLTTRQIYHYIDMQMHRQTVKHTDRWTDRKTWTKAAPAVRGSLSRDLLKYHDFLFFQRLLLKNNLCSNKTFLGRLDSRAFKASSKTLPL